MAEKNYGERKILWQEKNHGERKNHGRKKLWGEENNIPEKKSWGEEIIMFFPCSVLFFIKPYLNHFKLQACHIYILIFFNCFTRNTMLWSLMAHLFLTTYLASVTVPDVVS
jgi:hypothetical protein